jgi:rhomboid family protein
VLIGFFVTVTFVPAFLLIGLWVLIQLFSVGAVADMPAGGVAYVAHVGGVIFGAVTARLFEDPRRLAEQGD